MEKRYKIIAEITVSTTDDRRLHAALKRALSNTLDNISFFTQKNEILDNFEMVEITDMELPPLDAEDTAKTLIETEVSIDTYQLVQNRRLERLKVWEDKGIKYIADKERELIAHGEKVLELLKQHHSKT